MCCVHLRKNNNRHLDEHTIYEHYFINNHLRSSSAFLNFYVYSLVKDKDKTVLKRISNAFEWCRVFTVSFIPPPVTKRINTSFAHLPGTRASIL